MSDAIFILALLCALAGAAHKARTTWALLGSVALTSVLALAGVAFDPLLWTGIDLIVIAAMFGLKHRHGGFTAADYVVLLLFLPIWCLYVAHLPYAGKGVNLMVSLQLVIATPFRAIHATYRERARHAPDNWTEFDLRAAHDAA